MRFKTWTLRPLQSSKPRLRGASMSTTRSRAGAVYYGTNQQATVFYNDPGFGSTRVDLLGTNVPNYTLRSIEGEFSLLLQGGVSGSGPNLYESAASIRQTALVPASAQSMLFRAKHDSSGL